MSSIFSLPGQRLPNETLSAILVLMDPWDAWPLRAVCTNFNNYILRFIAPRLWLPMTTIFIRTEDSWIFQGANSDSISPTPSVVDLSDFDAPHEVPPSLPIPSPFSFGLDHRGQKFNFLSLRSVPGVPAIGGVIQPLADFSPHNPAEHDIIQAKLDDRVQIIIRIDTKYYRHVYLPSLVVDRYDPQVMMSVNWLELFNKTLNMPEETRRLKDARVIPMKLWIPDATVWVDRVESDVDSDEYIPSSHSSDGSDSSDDSFSDGEDIVEDDLDDESPLSAEALAEIAAGHAFEALVASLPITFSADALAEAGAIVAATPAYFDNDDDAGMVGAGAPLGVAGAGVEDGEGDPGALAELTEVLSDPLDILAHTRGFSRYETATPGLSDEDAEGAHSEGARRRHAFDLPRPSGSISIVRSTPHPFSSSPTRSSLYTTAEDALTEAFAPRGISGFELLPEYGSSGYSSNGEHGSDDEDGPVRDDEDSGYGGIGEAMARSIDVTSEEYGPVGAGYSLRSVRDDSSAMSVSMASVRSRPPTTSLAPLPSIRGVSGSGAEINSSGTHYERLVDTFPSESGSGGGGEADAETSSPTQESLARAVVRREHVDVTEEDDRARTNVAEESFLVLEDSCDSNEQEPDTSSEVRAPRQVHVGVQLEGMDLIKECGVVREYRGVGVQVAITFALDTKRFAGIPVKANRTWP